MAVSRFGVCAVFDDICAYLKSEYDEYVSAGRPEVGREKNFGTGRYEPNMTRYESRGAHDVSGSYPTISDSI